MKKSVKIFEGGYIRGGSQTLYMTRSDLVTTLATIKTDYPGNIRNILREAEAEAEELRTLRMRER